MIEALNHGLGIYPVVATEANRAVWAFQGCASTAIVVPERITRTLPVTTPVGS
jgi:hypothetical protein